MHRSARRLALPLMISASTLALAVPTAVAHDSYGSPDGDWQGFSSAYDGGEHDGWDRDRSDRQDDRDDGADRDAHDRADGDDRDRRSDQGRRDGSPDGDRTDGSADAANGEKTDDSVDGRTGDETKGRADQRADHRAGDSLVSPRVQRARERAARRIRRAGIEMRFLQDQQMMLSHLERADAFLVALGERIGQADLDPAVRSALLGLVDERRATVAGLVEQVQAAETAHDLEEIRPATHDPVGASSS